MWHVSAVLAYAETHGLQHVARHAELVLLADAGCFGKRRAPRTALWHLRRALTTEAIHHPMHAVWIRAQIKQVRRRAWIRWLRLSLA